MVKKLIILIVVFTVLSVGISYLSNYLAIGKAPQLQFTNENVANNVAASTSLKEKYEVETVAENLIVPWAIAFTSDTRMLVTERTGNIKEVKDGVVTPNTLLSLPVVAQGEAGLMGLVLDPNYQSNKLLYACYTYQNGDKLANRIIQIKDNESSLEVQKTILENAPAARFHAGCELAIGPDKKMYITFGDATEKSLAQDKNSLAGKILRINTDGTIPSDNPFSDSLVWSLGHRNPQGITWNPLNNEMYSVEHGPSGNDGPLGGDEVNHVIKGENYGWPMVSHDTSQAGLIDPLIVFTPAVAPASAQFYSGNLYPEFSNTLLFATLKGKGVYRTIIDSNNADIVAEYQKLPLPDLGRIREVTQGPDGYIYLTTSNTDGRGSKNIGDDKIVKILP